MPLPTPTPSDLVYLRDLRDGPLVKYAGLAEKCSAALLELTLDADLIWYDGFRHLRHRVIVGPAGDLSWLR